MRIIIIIFFLIQTCSLFSQILSKEQVCNFILQNSKLKDCGTITVLAKTKSAIAEDTSINIINYIYSLNGNTVSKMRKSPIQNGGNDFLLNGKHMIDKNIINNTYINYNDKAFNGFKYNPPIKEYLVRFYGETFFKQLKSDKFIFTTNEKKFIFTSFGLVYEFDKKDFTLKTKKEWIPTKFGVEYNAFEIINNYEDKKNCNDSLYDTKKFIKGVVKFKEKRTIKVKKTFNLYLDSLKNNILIPDTIQFILIDFFYQSCMPCVASFPDLIKLSNKPKFFVIGIDPNISDSLNMTKFSKRYGLNYPILVNSFSNRMNKVFNIENTYPFSILINKNGEIIETFIGYQEKFFNKINQILSK